MMLNDNEGAHRELHMVSMLGIFDNKISSNGPEKVAPEYKPVKIPTRGDTDLNGREHIIWVLC